MKTPSLAPCLLITGYQKGAIVPGKCDSSEKYRRSGWVRAFPLEEKDGNGWVFLNQVQPHLSQVELLVGVWEASEFPWAAVKVDITGAERRQESQAVVN